ncbi:hypothetical protein QF028_005958 [Neobacillus sp. B4I6]|uniref:hypothetical protein n=1 Tax=Neobacillus sp. B4I6 TaxID=3373925 RepID=UPI003D224918
MAGKVLAGTAFEIMKNQELLMKAKEELKDRLGENVYQRPIPQEVEPPCNRG